MSIFKMLNSLAGYGTSGYSRTTLCIDTNIVAHCHSILINRFYWTIFLGITIHLTRLPRRQRVRQVIEKFKNNEYVNRQLNSYEQSWDILNENYCSWFSSRVVKIKGDLDPEIIKQSLSVLQKQHPRLYSQIVYKADNCQFESGKAVIPVYCITTNSIEAEVIKQMNTCIETTKALMRVVIMRNPDMKTHIYLMLIYHHAIGDGISIIVFLEDLLSYYQKILENKPIDVVPNWVELLPIEAFMPDDVPEITPINEGAQNFAKLPFDQNVPLKKRWSSYIKKSLNENLIKKIIAASKAHNVTIQGTLNAALCMAFGQKLQHVTNITDHTISYYVYVNLRPFLKNRPEMITLNSFVSRIIIYHDIPFQKQEKNELFWKIARDSRKQITDRINKSAELFTEMKTAKEYTIKQLQSDNDVDVSTSISNLKVNIRSTYGAIELEDIYTVSPQGVFRYPHVFVSTFRNIMNITFCYSEPSHNRELIEDIANRFVSILINACR